MIKSRDYTSFDELLNLNELQSLHLFIFLVTWTRVLSINDALVLHESISSLKNKDQLLNKCLVLFQSHIEFITWLYNIRR